MSYKNLNFWASIKLSKKKDAKVLSLTPVAT